MTLTQKDINNNFYKRRKENGLCPRCGKKLDREGHYCSECLVKIRKYTSENRKFYRENHICTECGKNNVYGNDKICFECRAKKNNRRKPLNDKQKEDAKKRQRDLHAKRIEQGICTRCGKRKAVPNRKKCQICLTKDMEQQRKIRERKGNIKKYRRKNNLCYHCGNPIDAEKGQLCKKCLERCRQNGLKSNSVNDRWRKDNSIIFGKGNKNNQER